MWNRAIALLWVAAIVEPVSAQGALHDIQPRLRSPEDVAYVGDVNGDGWDDFAIFSTDPGRLIIESDYDIYSGKDLSVLQEVNVAGRGVRLIARFTDVNQDGRDDYVINTVGKTWVVSGRDTSPLFQHRWACEFAVATDDVTGDGVAELAFIVGASAVICDVVSGEQLFQIPSNKNGVLFTVSDLDGDGFRDIASSYHHETNFYSGSNGTPIRLDAHVDAVSDGSRQTSVVGGWDVNGNGFDDFFVLGQERLVAYDSQDGSEIYSQSVKETNPELLRAVPDQDGDHMDDLLVGDHFGVSLRSGRNGRLIFPFDARYTVEAISIQDFEGDGVPDFLFVRDVFVPFQVPVDNEFTIYAGDDLYLNRHTPDISVGSQASWKVTAAPPGGWVGIYVVRINGQPTLKPLTFGLADGNGEFTFSTFIGPAMQGFDVRHRAFATDGSGEIEDSRVNEFRYR